MSGWERAYRSGRGTLAEALATQADQRPDELAVRFVEPGGATLAQSQSATLTFAELAQRAAGIAQRLLDHAPAGERVLLLCPPGLDYVAALFGCFYSGLIAVPAYPPVSGDVDERLRGLLQSSRPSAMLTTSLLAPLCQATAAAAVGATSDVVMISVDELDTADRAPSRSTADDLALLQYTSGSTGSPRGVMLSHRNILANVSSIAAHLSIDADDRGAFWLPPYHDMGLIGGILTPLSIGRPTTLMSPLSFIANPLLWLEAISAHQATISAAPNFAFELCVRRADEERIAALDLRPWKSVVVGAEPIQRATLDRFVERFAGVGFRRSVLMPCYGLAEATLLVTASRLAPSTEAAETESVLARDAVPVGATDRASTVLIVDPATRMLCADGVEGEVWFQGPSVGLGYWEDEPETEAVFEGVLAEDPARGAFLRTGDLGLLVSGELYVTGRLKDLIIVRGQNHYPHDIENAITGADRRLRPGCVAAFEVTDGDGQRVVAVAEVRSALDREDAEQVWHSVRRAVSAELDLVLSELVLIERNTSAKTSSGKIRRRATREAYLDGTLAAISTHRTTHAGGPRFEGHAGGPRSEGHAGGPRSDRDAAVCEVVSATLAEMLGVCAESIDPHATFRELGLDSQGSVELGGRLAEAMGLVLPAMLVFDHPTPARLAGVVRLMLEGRPPTEHIHGGASRGGARNEPDEPLAIVGMSCRYPGGASSPEALWQLISRDEDAICPFPADRGWELERIYDPDPDRPGACYAREGGFLDGACDFDASFFGISPREALAMDPQQRLLLEVSWEAIEGAGIDPGSLAASPTGVFAGISSSEYGSLVARSEHEGLEGYRLTGLTGSVASGRVAYVLGLEGPAISVDTACSSSLVAVHLACQALRSGDCSLALAGGVTVMAWPSALIELSAQRVSAPDGRCKPFADGADGVGWSEGVGMLLLERLSDAQRNGHRVLALVRGSAVNQDGASNGLTAPNGASQQRAIMHALANAGLAPGDVDAVEAHGTGTRLGDPIEAHALLSTYGRSRDASRPVRIGSVKSNIGHAQAAAGVAGVIKMVMAMRHGVLPKTLHVDEPSSNVDWSTGALALLTEAVRWDRNGAPRRAAVSSFGMSGTNAHAILEEAPPPAVEDPAPASGLLEVGALPWLLSAKVDGALRDHAGRLRERVGEDDELGLVDVAHSLAARPVFEHRAVILGGAREDFLGGLQGLASAESAPNVIEGLAPAWGRRRVAFLFTGQGSQRVGMGRGLYEAFPVFRAALDETCAHLDRLLERPLLDVLFGDGDGDGESTPLDRTAYTQAALFALEAALFRLLESWGVKPDFLIGHSVGELAAAHVAGVLSLDDACTLVAARGRLMGALPEGGAMASMQVSEKELGETLEPYRQAVSLAAVNGPSSVVISGEESAVLELQAIWAERGRKTKRLQVSHAFHSHLMDGMLEEFELLARGVSFEPPRIPIVSNVTGEAASAEQICSAEYWVRHVREPVRFHESVRWLAAEKVDAFLELGPDGVLTAMAQECLSGAALACPALSRRRPEPVTAIGAVAALWAGGMSVDWARVFDDLPARRVDLPTYAFQRERCWIAPGRHGSPDAVWAGQLPVDRPSLLGVEWTPAKLGAHGPAVLGVESGAEGPALLDAELGADGPVLLGGWALLDDRERDSCGGGADAADVLRAAGALSDDAIYPDVESLLESIDDGVSKPRCAFVDLGAWSGADDAPVTALSHGLAGRALALLRTWVTDERLATIPLLLLTHGAVAVRPGERLPGLAQAAVWGLVRSAQAEHPGKLALVDVDEHEISWRGLPAMLAAAAGSDESQLAVREGEMFVPRLSRLSLGQAGVEAPGALEDQGVAPIGDASPIGGMAPIDGTVPREGMAPIDGTVLITGGTGGLGALVARHLVAERGVGSLVLASRRGPDAEGARELREALESLGAGVEIVACDVGDRRQVQTLLGSIPPGRPLAAVIHAAGVSDDGPVATLTAAQLDSVLASKLDGAWHLHELTQDCDLDAFVLFSSAAGVIGAPGQANYAAANAFLDALAADRRAQGLTAVSMAWGLWEQETGITRSLRAVDLARIRRSGIVKLSASEGLELLDMGWAAAESLVVPVRLQASALRALWQAGELPSIMAGLLGEESSRRERTEPNLLVRQLRDTPPEDHGRVALGLVRREVATVLGHSSVERVDVHRTLKDLGFDSLLGMELRNRLIRASGVSLPITLAFDYPTSAAMAEHLLERVRELRGESSGGAASQADAAERQLRSAIASIPIDRLRSVGLLDLLLRIAGEHDHGSSASTASEHAIGQIDSMEVEDLIQRAMQRSAAG